MRGLSFVAEARQAFVGRALGGGLVLLAAACSSPQGGDAAAGDATTASEVAQGFEKIVARIAARDGIELNTEIYVPTAPPPSSGWPIVITRTPYGLSHDTDGFSLFLSGAYRELAEDGYIFVFQDIRGRYGSGGTFAMQRTPRQRSGAEVDEASDTYDTIDWLLENVEQHNGRVGMLGVSYGGWLTMMALLDPHPALAAVSPQASPADMFLGDDFSHNGAFRLAAAYGYVALMETGTENAAFEFDQRDVYEWYLDLGPLANGESELGGPKPTWTSFLANPNYSEFWRDSSVLSYLPTSDEAAPQIPVLNVVGWWDAEDFWGSMKIYRELERWDGAAHNHLAVGPWRHGGWSRSDGSELGEMQFGSATGTHYREQIQRAFFAHHLRPPGAAEAPAWQGTDSFVFESGANRWHELAQFPPAATSTQRLYLQPGRGLGFEPPSGPEADSSFDQYVSDPASPVPYMPRPIPGFWQGGQALWKVADQRFVDGRPDVLSYQSEPLGEDLSVCGEITANLVASTSGTDSDWIVKLIDVFPEDGDGREEMGGFQFMVADEVFRARFRESFEQPQAVPANRPLTYRWELGPRCHTFLAGHSLMVQVQSTWFPLIGRNPQTFVTIPEATAADYQPAKQRIWRDGGERQSFVELAVWSDGPD